MGINILHKFKKCLNDQSGVILVIVLSIITLMFLSALLLSNMVKQDIDFIRIVKYKSQTQYMAEAGIQYAFARFKNEDFASKSAFSGSLDTGSYSVTFSKLNGRHLIISVGTVGEMSSTVSVEVENLTPSAFNFVGTAGNDIKIYSFVNDAEVNGDLHANDDVSLKSDWFRSLAISGRISAVNDVKEGSRIHITDGLSGGFQDLRVYINEVNNDFATIYENEPRATFPVFDYEKYKQAAIDSGDYYDVDTDFNSATLNPGNGIIYVDGKVRFNGICTLNGGIIADSIEVRPAGNLTQLKSGSRNVIIGRISDVNIKGILNVEEAVIYATRDIKATDDNADITINGIMMAKHNINMNTRITQIDYNYLETYPVDIGAKEGEEVFGIVSWNK